MAAEKEVQPVGEDYVEEERNAAGKLLQFNCKLCDCKFSDPNAKNIHIKGRKHRLQYKVSGSEIVKRLQNIKEHRFCFCSEKMEIFSGAKLLNFFF